MIKLVEYYLVHSFVAGVVLASSSTHDYISLAGVTLARIICRPTSLSGSYCLLLSAGDTI